MRIQNQMMQSIASYLRYMFGQKDLKQPPPPSDPEKVVETAETESPAPVQPSFPKSTLALIESRCPGVTARVAARNAAIRRLPPGLRDAMARQF